MNPVKEHWRQPFPLTDNEPRVMVPVCCNGFSASRICIYPRSRLVSIDSNMLFRCVRPEYPFLDFKTEEWRDLLGATTHAALGSRVCGNSFIFLTRGVDVSFSFTRTDTQPFGIWTDLVPVRVPSELQRLGRSLYEKKCLNVLTWATASHKKLGSQTGEWFRELSLNADLMQIIIQQCFQ
jgi:hypothetical protein